MKKDLFPLVIIGILTFFFLAGVLFGLTISEQNIDGYWVSTANGDISGEEGKI